MLYHKCFGKLSRSVEPKLLRSQEYVIKNRVFHLKKLKRPSRDLQITIQGQTNDTILWPPRNHKTVV